MMGLKKKKKFKYDQFTTLQPLVLRPEVEDLAQSLYELACCGSSDMWEDIKSSDELKADPQKRRKFLESSHKGMWEAQKIIVDLIRSKEGLTSSHDVLFRGIADSIAWQLLGMQLCYARRLYKGHPQPDLRHSNFDSVVLAAEHLNNNNPGSMALISDLTSFIQVGDLLLMGPTGNLTIGEVKEGKKNHDILKFMDFYLQHGCERSFFYFAQQEGPDSVKQLGRMLRQAERMGHVKEVINKGISVDPDTNSKVIIPENYVYLDSWNDELNYVIAESERKGWAISVIDECLFLGCYSEESMRKVGHMVFNSWFDNCGGTHSCPRSRLVDCMLYPLVEPIFNINIPTQSKFDILFGRKQVCMAINVESLLEQCTEAGLQVRYATNKEASRLDNKDAHPYRHNGKAIFIGNGKTEMGVADGIFLRIMFHRQRPIHLIKSILDNIESEGHNVR
jgi:hypothetical protein